MNNYKATAGVSCLSFSKQIQPRPQSQSHSRPYCRKQVTRHFSTTTTTTRKQSTAKHNIHRTSHKQERVYSGFWDNKDNQRQFLDRLFKQLQLNHWQDWYHVTRQQIGENGGWTLLQKHKGSNSLLLQSIYPQLPWQFWRMNKKLPKHYWNHLEHQRQYMDWLAKELNLQRWEDWYHVTRSQVCDHWGSSLLKNHFHGSLCRLLQSVYPQHPWQFWLFTDECLGTSSTTTQWHDHANQKQYMDWLTKQLNLQHWEDWYYVSKQDFVERGGKTLLAMYKNSIATLVLSIYPQHPWQYSKFGTDPLDIPENQVKFLDSLTGSLHIQQWQDWYAVTHQQLCEHGGTKLLDKYNNLMSVLIPTLYPQHPWQLWMFEQVPHMYWDNLDHQKQFMDWLSIQLQLQHWQDWYSVRKNQIGALGGWGLLNFTYNGSPSRLLKSVYPQHQWQPWKFDRAPKGYWNNKDHQKSFLDELKHSNRITQPEQWRKITARAIKRRKGGGLLRHYPSVMDAVASLYTQEQQQ